MTAFLRLGLFVSILFFTGTVSADNSTIAGFTLHESTPEKVIGQIKKLSPKAKISSDDDSVEAQPVRINKQQYNLLATFEEKDNIRVLSTLELTQQNSSKQKPSVLNGFKSTESGQYQKGNIIATVVEKDGIKKITFIDIKNNTANPYWGRILEVLKWVGILIGVYLFFVSLPYLLLWGGIGAVAGYILGDWSVGMFFGVIIGLIHYLIQAATRSKRGTVTILTSSPYNQSNSTNFPDNSLAINPANGLPMVGGQSGIDIHGNTYGSNFNDPH